MTIKEYLLRKGIKFTSAIPYKNNEELTNDKKRVIDIVAEILKGNEVKIK